METAERSAWIRDTAARLLAASYAHPTPGKDKGATKGPKGCWAAAEALWAMFEQTKRK